MTNELNFEDPRDGRMGAPYGREQTAALATEAGRDVNQALGRPRKVPHRHVIL
jgi:hypothetical protein